MSKKHRLKKKKKLKLRKKINNFVPSAETETKIKNEQQENSVPKKLVETAEIDSIIDSAGRKFISKDVRTIFITLALLTLLLITVAILQSKTEVINNFGDWLYKITNIQTM